MKVRVSQLPGVSELARDYFENFEKVAQFYNGDYRSPGHFLNRAAAIKDRDLPLAKLTPLLREQNEVLGCGPETLEKIDLLRERRACAIVTGQQTGLFTGPIFTIYKAMTAIKLAARLSRTCEGCYVPVFWLASDDHDFREVNHTTIIEKNNVPRTIEYDAHDVDSKLPVYNIPLDPAIRRSLDDLADGTHPSDYKEHVLSLLQAAYEPGTPFSTCFALFLTTLFKSFGLIVIDASDPRIKALGRELFENEIAGKSPSSAAVQKTSTELEKLGYHLQVATKPGFLNLFLVEPERASLQVDGPDFLVKNPARKYSEAALLAKVQEAPELFSPNVMLRPLYQDFLLPTMAYVAGSSEIAYYAQMKGIYEEFGMPMPIIYPRKSITLLEGKIEKVLDHHGLQAVDFMTNVETLINDIVRAQLPEKVETRVENARLCVEKNLEALQTVVGEFDVSLLDFVKNTRGRIGGQIQGLEKKILQAFKKRNDVVRQQIYKAGHSIYPNGTLQERKLNVVPYLFKHGLSFIDQLYESIDISNFDHQIVKI